MCRVVDTVLVDQETVYAQVCLGKVGAVAAREVSRFASSWQ
jgi:hypothetical protein